MSKNALPYYKAYPRDFFEGTMGMDGELKGQYRLLIDAIYMKGGTLPEDDRYIAGLLGVSLRKWRCAKIKLVDQGKIIIEKSIISNKRADFELETTSKYREKQAENRSNYNKNNSLQKPKPNQPEPEPYNTPSNEGGRAPQKKGSRIPKDWSPPLVGQAFYDEQFITVKEINHEADKFYDYWTARTGKDATKICWDATWRNWIRRDAPKRKGRGDKKTIPEIGEARRNASLDALEEYEAERLAARA